MSSQSMEREPDITTDHAPAMPETPKTETVENRLSKFVRRVIENAQRNTKAEERRAELERRVKKGQLVVPPEERYLGRVMPLEPPSPEDSTSL